MADRGIALTAINGGMNRLRTKGAARRDTLYLLQNGYVSAANTVKVRPGTIRNTDLSATAGAGTTKGVVGFQGALHTFSAQQVPVPPGYVLHVISHPAVNSGTLAQLTLVAGGVSFAILNGNNSTGPFTNVAMPNGGATGFSDGSMEAAQTFGNCNGVNPATQNIGGQQLAVAAWVSGGTNFPGNSYYVLAVRGLVAQNLFTSITFDTHAGSTTFQSASASIYHQGSNYTAWCWLTTDTQGQAFNGEATTGWSLGASKGTGFEVNTAGSLTPPTYAANGKTYPILNFETLPAGSLKLVFGPAKEDGSLAPQGTFVSVSFVDVTSTLRTFTSAAATFSLTGNVSTWTWATSPPLFAVGSSYTINFNQTSSSTIPLKEIHFAAPFMGFLYVVAEFQPDNSGFGSVFHYWLQGNTPWVANANHKIGDIVLPSPLNGFAYQAARNGAPNPVWSPNVKHAINDQVEPTVPNGFFFKAIAVEGANPTSGATEPSWPTTDGATITENSQFSSDQTATIVTSAPQPPTQVPNPATQARYKNLFSAKP